MSVVLFPHNSKAYENACAMMKSFGKAAIIHPTGTGKSFIAFKLCEDNGEKIICWLSPSEYIFKTQLENLAAVSGGYQPKNIRFFTYAKLMDLTVDELVHIRPDYIILDEFHRCGAQEWGRGVQALLECYADVPILGLSATNIRYLDNQRDMADELFDGNIASEISLGEAMVLGILNPPKYVLSVFPYQKDLQKYQHRVCSVKNKAARDEGEKYLEALRRALEKADGMDTLFYKHMTEPNGKYILFCANKEHMEEMVMLASEWFSKVDPAPHIYRAYAEDPGTSAAFAAFKADKSDHLKLLYCIDMLNEGVHVDDVDGVILLRPTVSPIIYKQQIGRALAAGKKKNAVIFDIVLNIENLYSIGAIQQEMELAMTYYRSLGQDGKIVNEQFQIIDEARNCIELFEKLNDSLTASWALMYHFAQQYADENGNLEVPKRYVTQEGYSLGTWIQTQRLVRAGKCPGNLSQEQIALLDKIGMRWGNARDVAWEKYFTAARQYYERQGNLLVRIDFEENGVALGRWIAQMRTYRKNGIQNTYLTQQRIAALDELGMIWEVPDYLWEQNFAAAMAYHRAHGNLDVPCDHVENGIRLGAWLNNIRAGQKSKNARTKLTEEQISRLNELGMNWDGKHAAAWERAYEAACRYKTEHGDLNIPVAYTTSNGIALGRWIRRQTNVTGERRKKLNELNISPRKDGNI